MDTPRFLIDLKREENRTQYLSALNVTTILFGCFLLMGVMMYALDILTTFQFVVIVGFVAAKLIALIHLRRKLTRWEGSIYLPLFLNMSFNIVGFTIVVYFTGPFTSHLFGLYLISVMVVALYYNLELSLIIAALATLLYGSMAWLVYLRLIPFPSPFLGQEILDKVRPMYILEVTGVLFGLMIAISLLAFFINRRLRESEREAQELSRIKEDFFNRVTHEFRVPLHGILGLQTLIREGIYGAITPKQQNALDMMERSSRSLLELVNDLLDLSRLASGKMDVLMERTSIIDVLKDISSVATPLALEKGLSFTMDLPEKLPPLMTDRAKLLQILTNLVSNAIKFTEKGSVTVRAKASDTTMSISVEDTGIGIEKGNLQKIFDEFTQIGRTADTKKKGSGLGLSISKRLAELLDGHISVQSTPGQGSIFTLTLPLSPSHPL